ncbi:MAG: ATP synthase subunit a [Parcubacteria group bacterium GW2011_GWA2_38_13]|nr:MAG: ATP synthase subunit a [Parcubacteria group bacterium GW2011_GWA2_38_13]
MNTEIQHETTLFAEPIFHIGSFTVTNSLLNSWIVVVIIVMLSVVIRRKISVVPRGFQNFMEMILDGALNLADTVTGSRKKTIKFMPVVFPLFIFIVLNNWLGIFPGIGSIGFIETSEEGRIFIPLFRGATADLNTTIALSIMAVVLTHIFGVTLTSGWKHLNRFLGINLFLELPRKIFKEKEYTAILTSPVQFFVGIVEIVGVRFLLCFWK